MKTKFEVDKSYNFNEVPIAKLNGELSYEPKYFLRMHSKKSDPADVQTQIWQCAFEPDPQSSYDSKHIVATCGGTSVCFLDVLSGKLLYKYENTAKSCTNENMYSLAWSSIPLDDLGLSHMNIVAVGGSRSTVLLMHPEGGACYSKFRTVAHKHVAICSLLFHPKKQTWLFCGHENGNIELWDVGVPTGPSYETDPCQLFSIAAVAGDVFNLTYSQRNDLLIAGCDQGLFAWHVDMEKIQTNTRLERMEMKLPNSKEQPQVVDSISLLRDDILACKCVLHGNIYLFNLDHACAAAKYNKERGQKEAHITNNMVVTLEWSNTDNYYMNMGVDNRTCLLVCGDDKGCLWVYDLYDYVIGNIESPLISTSSSNVKHTVDLMLHWPQLEDPEVEKARKLKLDTYDIVVDKCCISSCGTYIVAVTSNNMVCLWQQFQNT